MQQPDLAAGSAPRLNLALAASRRQDFSIRTPPESWHFAVREKRGNRSAVPQNRVLVVDDYADTADSMAALLRQSGCEVETADNGVTALDRAAHFRPELILMDLRMPLLDGVEACRRIRETWWGRNILIAAFTGAGLQPYQADVRQAGFDCFLLKPVPFVAIQKLLDSLRCY